jgi:hypothetical protein
VEVRGLSQVFALPSWATTGPITTAERAELERYFDERVHFALARGLTRGHFYQLTADSIMLEYRPDYAQRYHATQPVFRNRLQETGTESDPVVELIAESLQHLPMYLLHGWETGIYNEFRHLRSRGFSRAQLMELVLFAHLQTGPRGLQLVYNAVAQYLTDLPDGPEPAPFPRGWAPDPAAFQAGLDLSSPGLTDADRRNVGDWYQRTIGYVPNAVQFAMTYHPEVYKWQRARWEVIFQTLPKQVAPYIMLRQHLLTGSRDALREAVLLGKAWGISKEWTVHGLAVSAFYTGYEGLYTAQAAVGDLLDNWTSAP